jgi:hypothetical protein
MAATGNSCLLADLKKSSLLKPLGQMNPNLVDGHQVMAKAHIVFGKVC